MALNSLSFMLFVAAVVAVYYLVPKKYQWIVLLVASYGFYLSSGIKQVIFLIGTTLFTYLSGRWMQKHRDAFQKELDALGPDATREQKLNMKKAVGKRIHRIQVATALANLGVLALIKLADDLIPVFGGMFKWDTANALENIIVPLGLSYYTFNSIGYLIDVGRGKLTAEKNIAKFALFTSFFPSIVQGPLFRYGEVGTQLKASHDFDYDNLKYGAQLVLWGLFKKLVIADRVAAIARTVFAPGFDDYSGSQIFFGVLAYSFQIYGDFSGGTDITRGVAQMLGIDLPVNFERPFFANSMGDFWRRWHMSLGAWMREFVFYPVMLSKPVTKVSKMMRKRYGGHIGKIVPSVAAPLVVFFLIGIWHDVTPQYVTNGLYNAILISASVAFAPVFKKITEKLHINTETFSFRLFQIARTFVLLCISRIIVKAPSLGDAFKMIKAMFTDFDFAFLLGLDGGKIFTYGVDAKGMAVLFFSIMVLLVVGILQENGMKIRETLAKQNILFRWLMVLALICAILVFGMYGPGYDASAFIYGRF